MASSYRFWLRTTAVLQIIAASVHAMSFLKNAPPEDARLQELMETARPDLGPHFHPTQGDIFVALSSCFSFLYLFGGLTILYLLQKDLPAQTWKGLTSINLMVFGATFLIMFLFTFLPPIILTGMVFIGLCFAYATNHIHRIRLPKQ